MESNPLQKVQLIGGRSISSKKSGNVIEHYDENKSHYELDQFSYVPISNALFTTISK